MVTTPPNPVARLGATPAVSPVRTGRDHAAGESLRHGVATGAQPTQAARVLVAHGVPLSAVGLRVLIDGCPDLAACGIVSTSTTAASVARHLRPDIVVIDSALDFRGDGTRALRLAHPPVQVIALVGDDAESYVSAASEAGARGIVPQSANPATVLAAILAVYEGGEAIDPELARLLTDTDAASARLSERQSAVLRLIARGYTTVAIADTMRLSVETVRTHVKAILHRFGVRDRAHAVARGYELGLLGKPAHHGTTTATGTR